MFQEGALWGALTILSLLSSLASGTLQTWHLNTTLGAAPTASGTPTASPPAEPSKGAALAAAWSHLAGPNGTAAGPGALELAQDRLWRAERSPPGSGKGRKAGRRRSRKGDSCGLRTQEVRVRDLGLGFDSEEIVLFKYCSGACHRSRSNYDLTLAALLRDRTVQGPPGHALSHPCCRPTRYEDVSFMNVHHAWQTVEKLLAAECKCIG